MNEQLSGHARRNISLFPLGTVLFPGGTLPLKIFEQRYLDMTKACLRDNLPFGVCLIQEGHEVGKPAAPFRVGCLATIEQWEMPSPGLFHLIARGGERFRIVETSVASDGLISGDVELLPPAQRCDPDADCVALIKRAIDQLGADHFPQPVNLDDGAWVAYQVAGLFNFPLAAKQQMLQANAIERVYAEIKNYLKSNT